MNEERIRNPGAQASERLLLLVDADGFVAEIAAGGDDGKTGERASTDDAAQCRSMTPREGFPGPRNGESKRKRAGFAGEQDNGTSPAKRGSLLFQRGDMAVAADEIQRRGIAGANGFSSRCLRRRSPVDHAASLRASARSWKPPIPLRRDDVSRADQDRRPAAMLHPCGP